MVFAVFRISREAGSGAWQRDRMGKVPEQTNDWISVNTAILQALSENQLDILQIGEGTVWNKQSLSQS